MSVTAPRHTTPRDRAHRFDHRQATAAVVRRGAASEPVAGDDFVPDQSVRHPDALWRRQPHYLEPPPAVAAILDHRLSRYVDPTTWTRLVERHWVPATVAAAWGWEGLGWWAHLEPLHAWMTAGFLGVGFGGLLVAGRSHHAAAKQGERADPLMTIGSAAVGMAALVGGAGVGAGFSGISAMLTAGGSMAAGAGRILWLRSRHERKQDVLVGWTAAANPGSALPPELLPGPLPVPAGPGAGPHEMRLRQAFKGIGVEPIHPGVIRPAGQDAWTVVVTLPTGSLSPEEVIAKRGKLASNLGCTHLEIARTSLANQVRVTVYDGEDKTAEPLAWPGPQTTSFEQPISLGLFENLDPVMQSLIWNQTLIAGASDNGKSGVVNGILCSTMACTDLVRIAIDCKPGAPELGPYRRVLHHLADDPISAVATLYGLQAIIDVRGKLLAEKSEPSELNEEGIPVRKWNPKYGPYILAVVDELAELSRGFDRKTKERIAELLESNRQVGRFAGVFSLDSTQYPSNRVFGGRTDARQQYQVRIGMRTAETGAINVIMGTGAQGRGWRLDELPHLGSFMIASRQHGQPRRARAWWIPDELIVAVVDRYADEIQQLDERSATAFRDAYERAYAALSKGEMLPFTPSGPAGPTGGGPRGGEPADGASPHRGLYLVPTYPDGSTAVAADDRPLWQLLGEARDWISVPQLADAAQADPRCEKSSLSWVRERVRFWRESGWVLVEQRGQTPFYRRIDVTAFDLRKEA